MYDSPQDLLEALHATPTIVTTLVQACTDEQGRSAGGGVEGWTVVEVLCHLRDAEEEALARMRAMRDQTNPFLAAYDQERWAKERHYAQTQLHHALSAFCHWRAQFISELAQLQPEQWERPGQHEAVGQITISSHVLHIVSHDSIHLAQIARQLQDASV